MNENINLCEILKDCPKGTKFYSYIHGKVEFREIDPHLLNPIIVKTTTKNGIKIDKTYSKEGYYDDNYNGMCALVPSLEQPDWSKWKCPKLKFDPKTFKPFDRVLISDAYDVWQVEYFSHIKTHEPRGWCQCLGDSYYICIPYNDDTKHLVGTSDEAPEYYRYWED